MVIEQNTIRPGGTGLPDWSNIMQDINFSAMSADELRSIIAAVDSYNERRYSRPWIVRVTDWPVGGRPSLDFGRYVGAHGDDGEAEIMARAGDIVRWGQKDGRGNGTRAYWGVVEKDGTVTEVTEAEARKHIGGK